MLQQQVWIVIGQFRSFPLDWSVDNKKTWILDAEEAPTCDRVNEAKRKSQKVSGGGP